jgi:hypothetical protein
MPDEALTKLIKQAITRFHSVMMEWTIERDDALLDSALRRRVRSQSGSAVALLSNGNPNGGLPDAGTTALGKLWWRKPTSWRDEATADGLGTTVRILDNSHYVGYSSRTGLLSTNLHPRQHKPRWTDLAVEERPDLGPYTLPLLLREVPLVEPAFLIGTCSLNFEGTGVHIGRDVIKVKAVRRAPECRAFFRASELEYNLLVDADTGILLRYVSMVEDREAWRLTVTSVTFDQPIPDDVFAFQPPEGTTVKLTA